MNDYVRESEENLQKQLQDLKRVGGISSFAQGIHPNPHFYKYHWQIYICPPEGTFERLKRNYGVRRSTGTVETEKERVYSMPKICHAEFLKKREWLKNNRIACVISNIQTPRRDPSAKWDYNAMRWEGVEFAPSLNDDTDELTPDGYR